MGLDMYLMAEKDGILTEISYWRKHPNLHGAMENLWRSRFSPSDNEWFNCIRLYLDKNDIEYLMNLIRKNKLPDISGFFFGTSKLERLNLDLKYFTEALSYLEDGYKVFYDSWW